MKANTPYKLKVTVDEFFEKTLKNEFAVFLRDNGLVVSPSRVEIGEFEDIAYFESGSVEYELPGMYWKYFEEVGEEAPEPFVEPAPVATVAEMVAKESPALTGLVVTSGTFRVNDYQNQPQKLGISPDWLNQESVNDLDTSSLAGPTGDQLFLFYHTYVQRSGSRYYLGGRKSAEEVLNKTKELYALHQRGLALDKLKRLIREEYSAVADGISQIVKPK